MSKVRLAYAVLAALVLALSTGSAWGNNGYDLRRAPRVKPAATAVYPGLSAGTLVVKFVDDIDIIARDGRLYHSDGRPVEEISGLIDQGRAQSAKPEFAVDKATLLRWRTEGQARAGVPLADLTAYFRLVLAPHVTVPEAARMADLLNRSLAVEIAYLEAKPEVASDITPATPDFEPTQDYLKPAPGGVDAYAAWGYPGGRGEGVRICDIEYGWQTDHEDLSQLAAGGVIGGDAGPDDHGTAVMGEMLADSSISTLSGIGYGVTGIAHGAVGHGVSVASRSTADAILLAGASLVAGDIILIELHQPGPNSTGSGQVGFVPMEWTPSVFDAIQTVTANGIIVCEAAGNGGENLDLAVYGGWFDTTMQHSGAIMCGAGAPPSGVYGPDRTRLSFSNYGMRVDLQGYGNGVVTTGYGGLFDPGDPRQVYTATFSGTSSASPIVTATVACIQGRFKSVSGGYTMTAQEIRNLLYATGSPQTGTTSQHIGPRPNLGAAMPLVSALSAYASPRTFNVSLLADPQVTDTLWLINPNASATTYNIAIVDSLPAVPSPVATAPFGKDALLRKTGSVSAVASATSWISVSPTTGTIPASDSVAVEVIFDGDLLSSSYFGSYYKARLDLEVNGAAGMGTIPVPILALAQDSLHGDTILVTSAAISHRATSETNMQGWDYTDLSASGWLYDGSFVVGRPAAGDTTVYRDIFGNARMWRGRDFWQADSITFPGYVIWRDSSMTEDSIIGLAYEAWVPTSGDSAEFVYWRVNLVGRTAAFANITFGIAGDWDLPASSGASNFGGFDTTRQMIYQTGNTGFESYAAGYALLGAKAHSAVVGSNPVDVYPTGGFVDSKLYTQMRTAGYRVDATNTDLHTILAPYFGTVPMTTPLTFEIAVLSSQAGVAGLEAVHARAKHLSDTLRYISCPIAKTGDVNEDDVLTSADIIALVNFVFKGGAPPRPIQLAGDVDCSGAVTSGDIITMVNYVLKGGPDPCDACTIY